MSEDKFLSTVGRKTAGENTRDPEQGREHGAANRPQDVQSSHTEIIQHQRRTHNAERLAQVGYWEWDQSGGTDHYCSGELAKIYGISVDEYLERGNLQEHVAALVHPEDVARYQRVTCPESVEGNKYEVEYRIITANGSVKHVIERAEYELDENGAPVRAFGTVQDITDRKELEVSLFESERHNRIWFENAAVGIGRSRLSDGKMLIANSKLAEMFGYESADDFLANCTHAEKYIDAEQRRALVDNFANKHEQVNDLNFMKADGSMMTGRTYDRLNSEAGWLDFVVVDITEQKRAEEEAAKNEARLYAILENLPVEVALKDTDGRYVYANFEFENRFGLSKSDVYGRTAHEFDFVEKTEADRIHAEDRHALEDRVTISTESSFIGRNGKPGVEIVTKFPVIHANGEIIGVATIAQDITKLKRAEEAVREARDELEIRVEDRTRELNESESRFRDFVETSSDLYWELDENLNYVTLAYSDPHDIGIDNSMYIGKPRSAFKPAGMNDTDWQKHMDDLNDHRPVKNFVQTRSLSADEDHWLSVNGKPVFDEDGTFAGYRGTAKDISEQKLLERMKNDFISTISHELRTPLTSISGSLKLLAGGALGDLPSKAAGMVGIANNNAERLIHLVNDILDMEKLVSGNMAYDFHSLNISSLVAEAVKSNDGYAIAHDVAFVLGDMVPDAIVKGDDFRLTQVLSNFLSNAAKFTPAGGQVTISVTADTSFVTVTVADSGPGIADSFKDHVFGRFTQGDSSDAREKGGSGLGLNISKSIIDDHEGTIGFKSEPDIGCRFFFTLPIVK